MQKIFSARIDEAVLNELDRVTRQLGVSKRQFLEEAILERAAGLNAHAERDVWTDTLGAWRRRERPQTTIRRSRAAFRRTFSRRHDEQTDARVRR